MRVSPLLPRTVKGCWSTTERCTTTRSFAGSSKTKGCVLPAPAIVKWCCMRCTAGVHRRRSLVSTACSPSRTSIDATPHCGSPAIDSDQTALRRQLRRPDPVRVRAQGSARVSWDQFSTQLESAAGAVDRPALGEHAHADRRYRGAGAGRLVEADSAARSKRSRTLMSCTSLTSGDSLRREVAMRGRS